MNCDTKLWLVTDGHGRVRGCTNDLGASSPPTTAPISSSDGCAEIARLLERKGFYSRGGDGAPPHYRLEPVSVTEETA